MLHGPYDATRTCKLLKSLAALRDERDALKSALSNLQVDFRMARERETALEAEVERLKLTGIGELQNDYQAAMEELCVNDYSVGTLTERVVAIIRAIRAAYGSYVRVTKERDEAQAEVERLKAQSFADVKWAAHWGRQLAMLRETTGGTSRGNAGDDSIDVSNWIKKTKAELAMLHEHLKDQGEPPTKDELQFALESTRAPFTTQSVSDNTMDRITAMEARIDKLNDTAYSDELAINNLLKRIAALEKKPSMPDYVKEWLNNDSWNSGGWSAMRAFARSYYGAKEQSK
jgi:hypothetical protein